MASKKKAKKTWEWRGKSYGSEKELFVEIRERLRSIIGAPVEIRDREGVDQRRIAAKIQLKLVTRPLLPRSTFPNY